MLGCSHFYLRGIRKEQVMIPLVIAHYVGLFSFLQDNWKMKMNEPIVIAHYVGLFSFLRMRKAVRGIPSHCDCPLCWAVLISTKISKTDLSIVGSDCPLCWAVLISTFEKNLKAEWLSCDCPLCWAVLISTYPLGNPHQ